MAKKKISLKKESSKKEGKSKTIKTTESTKKAPKKVSKRIEVKASQGKSTRKPNAAFMVALTPSPALAEIVGKVPLPRTEIIKSIWVYIRQNGLQDNVNKRMINTDFKLKLIFDGKDQVSMFDLAKVVNNHVKK